jgi:pantoate--beta-alanine ligase
LSRIIRSISEMQQLAETIRLSGRKIGFVPTMGYLHEGHLSLIDQAKKNADWVVISIFVNPAQFGPNEDFELYPRDFQRDEKLAASRGVDCIFYPEAMALYPNDYLTWVNVERLPDTLCGASRPGHFRGVATIVAKLFNIVKPHCAVFGQKDAQQAAILHKMIIDLNFDIRFILAETKRESDGLAMSSRNVNLTAAERAEAPRLYESLLAAAEKLKINPQNSLLIAAEMKKELAEKISGRIDYLEIISYPQLQPFEKEKYTKAIIALAVFYKNVRLIDNVMVEW